jgi:hypothetical protein
MDGVFFAGESDFASALAPLHEELASLHWAIDVQCGPWAISDKPDFETLDAGLGELA